MAKKAVIRIALTFSFLSLALTLTASASPTESLQPASLGGVGQFDSLQVGSQGVGGVTYFNGTIINETTDGGNDVPVTFGDNVRIDGAIIRGEAGATDDMPVKIGDDFRVDGIVWGGSHKGIGTDKQPLIVGDNINPALSGTNDFGSSNSQWRDIYYAGTLQGLNINTSGAIWGGSGKGIANGDEALTVADAILPAMDDINDFGSSSFRWRDAHFSGTVSIGSLSGNGVITSNHLADNAVTAIKIANGVIGSDKLADNSITGDKIFDGTIAEADLENDSVTSGKITDGIISENDLANDSVTPDKINGVGGANLPIAYASIDDSGSVNAGTSNVSSTWDGANSRYTVSIDNVLYDSTKHVVLVTPVTSRDVFVRTGQDGSNNLLVYFKRDGGVDSQEDFHFVVYEP